MVDLLVSYTRNSFGYCSSIYEGIFENFVFQLIYELIDLFYFVSDRLI